MGVCSSCISLVVETLLQLLEELSKPYIAVQNHPIHVLHSELYVLELLADCCSTHWASINLSRLTSPNGSIASDTDGSGSDGRFEAKSRASTGFNRPRRSSRNELHARDISPEPLEDDLVRRILDAIKLFLKPLPDTYILPPANILDDTIPLGSFLSPESANGGSERLDDEEVPKLLLKKSEAIDAYTRGIVEYISFSNWSRVLEYLKLSLRTTHPAIGNAALPNINANEDRSALVTLQLISSFWVDSLKLSIIIQELCGSFLHLRKAFQTTIAIVLPLLVTRWLERNPDEFIQIHTMHKRLDGGAETLFDMSNTMFDGGKRKSLLYPFQTSLLFLLPDVFEVATHMRDVKSSSISKKVSFLEMLRKSLRNRNETAIYCLTSVLRVARHFTPDSDAAILSYALDVHEEVREAVFRKSTVGMDATAIDNGLMTATFVSLAHLNFDLCVESLAPICLAPNSPAEFKFALISACTHFARQVNASDYQALFAKVVEFISTTIKVASLLSSLGFTTHSF